MERRLTMLEEKVDRMTSDHTTMVSMQSALTTSLSQVSDSMDKISNSMDEFTKFQAKTEVHREQERQDRHTLSSRMDTVSKQTSKLFELVRPLSDSGKAKAVFWNRFKVAVASAITVAILSYFIAPF